MVREHVDLPTEFADALEATKLSLDELAKRMYNHAQEIAESRVRETITAARKAKESAEFEVAEAMDMVNSLDEEKQELTSSLEKTWHQLQEAKADNTRLQERIETLTHRAKKDTEALTEAKAGNAELQKSNTTLIVQKDLADKQFEEVKLSAKETEQRLNKANQLTENMKVELATLKADKTNLQTSFNTLEVQSTKAQAKNERLKTTIEKLTAKNHHHETTLAISNTKREEAEQRIKSLDTKLKASRKAEEGAKIEASELKGKLKIFESQSI